MATDPLIGTTVGGCEILDVIGQGGMGVIYKARQKSLDRVVALKVLARHLANDISFVTRFQKEARAIAKVNHPNILAVYDVGDDNHVNYMIMELIEGTSLAELQTERRGAIPWEEATDYIRQAAQGLEAGHAAGIVHRDIKPENLLVTKKNVIKVSDFGLAKEASTATGVTSVDAVMGTPAFMSPEQCDGKKVDARSDIYSLGGTYYRLATGRLPFEAETAMSMMYRHKHEALIPPHEVVNTVPPSISAVIVKMMAKRREQRYQTMTEVLDALDAARKEAAAPHGQAVAAAITGPAEPLPPPLAAAPPAFQASPASEEAGRPGRGRPATPGMGTEVPPRSPSQRLLETAGPSGGLIPTVNSSARLNISSMMGIAAAGLPGANEGYSNVSRGDEMLARGDRMGGLRYYRLALQSPALDQATRGRLDQELRKEITVRRQAMDNMLTRGMLVEASRECRLLVELDPSDELSRNTLKDLDSKLASKRTMVNDIRTAIAASAFEKAIKTWDGTPAELRDEGLGRQIEQLRTVVVPALKLAEQGDNFSRQGRLEEAISSYEDAIKINPNCEPARIGQKDTVQKLQRIEYMLKEGFQHSLEQNYSKAVETWKPILALRPGHAQAVKSIVDAYLAGAQQLRARGDLEGALAAYQGAAETDPQNRSARRLLEDLTNLHDKEQALIDRAQDAVARNRLGAAIGYWKEVQNVNPASKRAAQQIQELRRQHSRALLKAFILLAALLAAGMAGLQYYSEARVLGAAREKMQNKQYGEAVRLLGTARIFFLPAERQQIIEGAGLWLKIEEAKKTAEAGKPDKAVELLDALAQSLKAANQQPPSELALLTREFRAQHAVALAKQALQQGKWEEAARHCSNVLALTPANLPASAQLDKLRALAEKGGALAQRLLAADQAKDNPQRRLAELQAALNLAQELSLPVCAKQIGDMLAKLNFNPAKLKELIEAAKAELAKVPPDLVKARELFLVAERYYPAPEIKRYLQYLDDGGYCDKAGMSLFAPRNPIRGGAWTGDERRDAFCIDRYEWPNKAGAMPRANVTWLEARDLCQSVGKKLCSLSEWEDACKGVDKTRYPYGLTADPAACNTDGRAVMASGAKTACRNAIGVYDMSGNLAEWTDRDGDAEVRGGAYDTPVGQASCIDALEQKKSLGSPRVGFRCCRRLPEDLPARP